MFAHNLWPSVPFSQMSPSGSFQYVQGMGVDPGVLTQALGPVSPCFFWVKMALVSADSCFPAGLGGAGPKTMSPISQVFILAPGTLSYSHGDIHLDCLGSIQDKITVCATDDSYQKARQSMAQAEEETRSRGAIVIKPGGRYLGKDGGTGLHPWGIPPVQVSCLLSNCWGSRRHSGPIQQGAGVMSDRGVAPMQNQPGSCRVRKMVLLRQLGAIPSAASESLGGLKA